MISTSVLLTENVYFRVGLILSNCLDKEKDVLQVDVEAELFQFAEYADHYRGSKVTSCCCAKSYIETDPSYIKYPPRPKLAIYRVPLFLSPCTPSRTALTMSSDRLLILTKC